MERILKKLDNIQKKDLCLSLLHADTEKEVEKILRKHDLWYHEEIGDLENAAKMYSYSYDYCMDKSVELYEKISKV